jgi:hypothetical protein
MVNTLANIALQDLINVQLSEIQKTTFLFIQSD